MSHVPVTPLLRGVFVFDALASAGVGALTLLGGAWLQQWLQLPRWLLVSASVVLLAYGLYMGWLSRRERVSRPLLWALVAFNVAWAVECVALAFGGWLSPSGWGQAYLVAQVPVVLLVAELQFVCLRRAREPGARAYA